jgi:hypothetical protein
MTYSRLHNQFHDRFEVYVRTHFWIRTGISMCLTVLLSSFAAITPGGAVGRSTPSARMTLSNRVTKKLPTCVAGHIQVKNGPAASLKAGEQAITVALTNTGTSSCGLEGYPNVQLFASGGTVLTLKQINLDQYVAKYSPRLVALAAGTVGYFEVSKFRCTSGNLQAGTRLQFFLPGIYGGSGFAVAVGGPGLDSCAGSARNRDNRLAVSPIVASRKDLLP